ncbi:putative acetyltransferase [Hyphomonas adhaerens MHS-3]|uniref:Putative acetyltransferase n=1 Tax=Hyphomonas adhaerens MHS-3 TaxID=1280949 RepID=A0A069E9G1_9PROT|nr:GNAT family N-acetyltransferase [Hyphomonas adhaerens]KCZ85821.1 putative acetyltransferase [Hyphomonas adhaerens MHS-3]
MDIAYIHKGLITGWRSACEQVAAEKAYLGLVSLPPFDPERALPNRMIARNWPMYCALDEGRVVGWVDIIPNEVPECAHRGTLGMGLLASHRGRGLGSRLLEAALGHAPESGLTKVELAVYTSNVSAISLFLKFGFTEAGMWRDYRRLDGVTYDALLMERFLV